MATGAMEETPKWMHLNLVGGVEHLGHAVEDTLGNVCRRIKLLLSRKRLQRLHDQPRVALADFNLPQDLVATAHKGHPIDFCHNSLLHNFAGNALRFQQSLAQIH